MVSVEAVNDPVSNSNRAVAGPLPVFPLERAAIVMVLNSRLALCPSSKTVLDIPYPVPAAPLIILKTAGLEPSTA